MNAILYRRNDFEEPDYWLVIHNLETLHFGWDVTDLLAWCE